MAFLVISAGLALAAVAFICVPLWRAGGRSFAAALAIGLPLAALGLYTWTSDWSWDQPPAPAASRMPGSLEEAVRELENDHEFLLQGGVFSQDLIQSWIDYKRENDIDPMRLRPHPHEFELYYDV